MRSLRAAIGFLTRVPVGEVAAEDLKGAVGWFPAIGGLIGVTTGGTYIAARHGLPPMVAAGLAVAVGLLVTGAFHHDGLADMADAFGGGWTREQRLAILKDSRHGTYGVVSLVMILILQVSSVASMSGRHGFIALIVGETLGRAGAVGLMVVVRPANADGLAVTAIDHLNRRSAGAGVIAGLGLTVVALVGWPLRGVSVAGWSVVVVSVALLAVIAVGLLALRKIGGVVGDVLGAAEQVAHTCVLIAILALTRRN